MLRHLPREAVRACPIVPNTLQFAIPAPTGPSSPCHQVNVPSPTERVGDRPVEWALNTSEQAIRTASRELSLFIPRPTQALVDALGGSGPLTSQAG